MVTYKILNKLLELSIFLVRVVKVAKCKIIYTKSSIVVVYTKNSFVVKESDIISTATRLVSSWNQDKNRFGFIFERFLRLRMLIRRIQRANGRGAVN